MTRSLTGRPSVRRRISQLVVAGLLLSGSMVLAQQEVPKADPKTAGEAPAVPKPVTILSGRADADAPTELLAPRYENRTAGISFRPPAIARAVEHPSSDEIAEYANEEKGWLLRVTKPTFPSAQPLSTQKDAATGKENMGCWSTPSSRSRSRRRGRRCCGAT